MLIRDDFSAGAFGRQPVPSTIMAAPYFRRALCVCRTCPPGVSMRAKAFSQAATAATAQRDHRGGHLTMWLAPVNAPASAGVACAACLLIPGRRCERTVMLRRAAGSLAAAVWEA